MLFQVKCDRCGKSATVLRIEVPTAAGKKTLGDADGAAQGSYVIDCPECGMRNQPPKTKSAS